MKNVGFETTMFHWHWIKNTYSRDGELRGRYMCLVTPSRTKRMREKNSVRGVRFFDLSTKRYLDKWSIRVLRTNAKTKSWTPTELL